MSRPDPWDAGSYFSHAHIDEPPFRLLVTGSREWDNRRVVEDALESVWNAYTQYGREAVLVHGDAVGLDKLAASLWPGAKERYPASWFGNPLERNEFMVDQGAHLCLAFATRWASGTGHCARVARRAGISVVDYGVCTDHR